MFHHHSHDSGYASIRPNYAGAPSSAPTQRMQMDDGQGGYSVTTSTSTTTTTTVSSGRVRTTTSTQGPRTRASQQASTPLRQSVATPMVEAPGDLTSTSTFAAGLPQPLVSTTQDSPVSPVTPRYDFRQRKSTQMDLDRMDSAAPALTHNFSYPGLGRTTPTQGQLEDVGSYPQEPMERDSSASRGRRRRSGSASNRLMAQATGGEHISVHPDARILTTPSLDEDEILSRSIHSPPLTSYPAGGVIVPDRSLLREERRRSRGYHDLQPRFTRDSIPIPESYISPDPNGHESGQPRYLAPGDGLAAPEKVQKRRRIVNKLRKKRLSHLYAQQGN